MDPLSISTKTILVSNTLVIILFFFFLEPTYDNGKSAIYVMDEKNNSSAES